MRQVIDNYFSIDDGSSFKPCCDHRLCHQDVKNVCEDINHLGCATIRVPRVLLTSAFFWGWGALGFLKTCIEVVQCTTQGEITGKTISVVVSLAAGEFL